MAGKPTSARIRIQMSHDLADDDGHVADSHIQKSYFIVVHQTLWPWTRPGTSIPRLPTCPPTSEDLECRPSYTTSWATLVIDVRQLTNGCYLVTKHRYAADFYCDCGWTPAALVSRLRFRVLHRLAAVVIEVAHVVLAQLHPLVSVANIPAGKCDLRERCHPLWAQDTALAHIFCSNINVTAIHQQDPQTSYAEM